MTGINQTITHFYIHAVLPKPGVVDFLKRMEKAEIPMCIATASDRYQIEAALRRCGMKHYFDADRSSAVVFEDANHAIRTAKADGFTVVAVFDSSENRQAEIRDASTYASGFSYLLDLV